MGGRRLVAKVASGWYFESQILAEALALEVGRFTRNFGLDVIKSPSDFAVNVYERWCWPKCSLSEIGFKVLRQTLWECCQPNGTRLGFF